MSTITENYDAAAESYQQATESYKDTSELYEQAARDNKSAQRTYVLIGLLIGGAMLYDSAKRKRR